MLAEGSGRGYPGGGGAGWNSTNAVIVDPGQECKSRTVP